MPEIMTTFVIMTIQIDTTLGQIDDRDTGKRLIDCGRGYAQAMQFNSILDKILTTSQFYDSIQRDGTYKLSKKKQVILAGIIQDISKNVDN